MPYSSSSGSGNGAALVQRRFCVNAAVEQMRMTAAAMTCFLVGCRNIGFLSTVKVVRLVDAAGSLVHRHLRIGTERTRAVHFAAGRMRGEDRGRRLPLLAPLLERAQRVKDVRPFAAATVAHAGGVEETDRVVNGFLANRLHDAVVVHERRPRRDIRIGPSLVNQKLA